MTGGGSLSAGAVLTATGGLIALQIGLYTLVGRERKSPYVINNVFSVFIICLVVATLASFSVITKGSLSKNALTASIVLLIIALLASLLSAVRTTTRFLYFVDSLNPKHWGIVRALKSFKNRGVVAPTYEHNPIPVPEELRLKIESELTGLPKAVVAIREGLEPLSLAASVQHQGEGNIVLAKSAKAFLAAGFAVQYLTASRHPVEFIGYLAKACEADGMAWQSLSSNVIAIDAYSSHFAFTDSIYPVKTRQLEALGVAYVQSAMTFAGIHSAAGRAFKQLKKTTGIGPRKPTLVIYEGTYALADLESPEQYRIFLRHVLPSERMWGGMFTIFVESAQPDGDWNVLQSYASMTFKQKSGAD